MITTSVTFGKCRVKGVSAWIMTSLPYQDKTILTEVSVVWNNTDKAGGFSFDGPQPRILFSFGMESTWS